MSRTRAAGRRLLEKLAPTAMHSISEVPRLRRRVAQQDVELAALRRKLDGMHRRLSGLEEDIQEARRLQQRVAELADVMAEVLVPVADRNDERVRKALESFARTSL